MAKKVENIFKINKVLEKANVSNDLQLNGCRFFAMTYAGKKLFEVDFKEIKPLPKG